MKTMKYWKDISWIEGKPHLPGFQNLEGVPEE